MSPRALADAAERGAPLADLTAVRALAVRGPDARRWLGDLVTSDVATLGEGQARRSLLLSPTGRIRADLTLLAMADGFLLLQSDDQPEAIGGLLEPFVLSSAVELCDVSAELAIDGPDDRDREIARVRRGAPRMGVDYPAGALPTEAGLDGAIDQTKGCFLGQEAVAKVRVLGHPRTVLRHLRSTAEVEAGTPVHTREGIAGAVTSVAPAEDGGWVLIASVGWDAARADLSTGAGDSLLEASD